MVRFIPSADWQLGARFQQFGAKADALRAARLTTLRRALELAREEAVDAFLLASPLKQNVSSTDPALKLSRHWGADHLQGGEEFDRVREVVDAL